MSKIRKIADGVNVGPLLWALQSHPELWDQITSRTESPDSPHHGVSDIWVRYGEPGIDRNAEHDSIWYPSADVLPVRELALPLMAAVGGERLGGVLVTKIPPGGRVRPHADPGWHAGYYDKYAVQIQSHPLQSFNFEGESLVSRPGDVYWFDNQHTHWVTNDSDQDRITLIVCIRAERGISPCHSQQQEPSPR